MIRLLSQAKTIAKDFLESRRWPLRPQNLNFEISAACDAKCVHCPRLDMDRPMKAMPMPLFRKMIDEAADLQVPFLCPNGYGEICTIPVPALTEYFDYISSKAWKFLLLINTNANRMNEERAALFLKQRVKLVNVTIDGATAETAESIRVNLNFDQIETNIKRLLKLRDAAGQKYPKVRVSMIAMPKTIPEWEPFRRRWEGVADYVGMGGFTSRLSSVKAVGCSEANDTIQLGMPSRPQPDLPGASACSLPFSDLNIWADGKVVLCCQDWNEEHVVGDLNTETLSDVWRGLKMTKARRLHIEGRGHEISLCAKCDSWLQPSYGARLWS